MSRPELLSSATSTPTGSLQQVRYEVLEVGGKSFLAFTAAAYRTPDDERPGIGTAWEPIPRPPHLSPVTRRCRTLRPRRGGRAIVAALAADTKKGVASSEEVRNRQQTPAQRAQRELAEAVTAAGMVTKEFAEWAMTTRNVDLKTAGIAVLVPLTREVQEKGEGDHVCPGS